MTTRRRFLAVLGATGLIPARALAQNAESPRQMQVCEAKHRLEDYSVAGLTLREDFELDGTSRGATATYHAPNLSASAMAPFRDGGPLSTLFRVGWSGYKIEALAPISMGVSVHGLGVDDAFVTRERDALARTGQAMMGFDGSVAVDYALVFPDGHRIEESGTATRSTSDGTLFGGISLSDGAAAPAFARWKAAGSVQLEGRLKDQPDVVIRSAAVPYPADLLETTWAELAREVRAARASDTCTLQRRPPDCFLTTAAVETVGLPDDCYELRTLRGFRDGPLRAMPGGEALVAAYYAQGPAIVAGVSARPDAARQWLRTYVFDILPCVALARLGLNGAALRRYRAMVERLASRQS